MVTEMGKAAKVLTISSTSNTKRNLYHVVTRSATGYKKVLRDMPCEDAVGIVRFKKAVICAVADGHGDPKCKYASIGSRLATETACGILRDAVTGIPNITTQYDYFCDCRDEIAQQIVLEWNKAVFEDFLTKVDNHKAVQVKNAMFEYIDSMFSPTGKQMSMEETRCYYADRDALADFLHQITKLYGTTLNAVVATENFIFCIGIGDGDIIAVQGKRVDWLLPPSEQFSTRTESLCYKPQAAFEAFHSVVIRKTKSKSRRLSDTGIKPDYILLASDGLRNSFLSDEHFVDRLISIGNEKSCGYVKFQRNSQRWIEQLTKDSLYQDDITFGFIY